MDEDTFDAACAQAEQEEAQQRETDRLILLADRLAYEAFLIQMEWLLNQTVGRARP
jgi:hypothetical protein